MPYLNIYEKLHEMNQLHFMRHQLLGTQDCMSHTQLLHRRVVTVYEQKHTEWLSKMNPVPTACCEWCVITEQLQNLKLNLSPGPLKYGLL